ncbi:MAG: polynucleotide kinase-phosphatase [bacterium]|nr:polynucleotide kinase-phosphatase [bacterium]
MRLSIPDFALVSLIGASGSGKSTFALKHFLETEIVSSDRCRALVADDEADQSSTRDAFDVLYTIVGKRLASRRLTVIDATNLRPEDRAKGIDIARKYHALPVAIVFDFPPELSVERNKGRANRPFGAKVVYDHVRLLRKSIKNLRREGYRTIYVLDDPAAIDDVTVVREPLYNDRRGESGPFDIIGDVHGCFEELTALLVKLGYAERTLGGKATWAHPDGRRAIFLGDLVDRGPGVLDVLRLVMSMVEAGTALCVPGNHERKLARKLNGKNVTVAHGLAETLAQLDTLPDGEREAFAAKTREFIDGLVSHYWLDGGKLVVAHAGLRADMQGRGSREVREFALYGETTGETDEFGMPVRYDWAKEYRGSAIVAYGHTPVPEVEWVNKTVCLDTGCVYGGSLTAMRYPELEFVSVAALRTYVEPVRPLVQPESSQIPAQSLADAMLDIEDVLGKRRIETRFGRPVMIPAENAAAALEVISRFCVDPRWLIYLPPTMSPSETSKREALLEHPDEAFAYYRNAGVQKVVLEEKHMGSRAVLVIARDEDSARRRFGVTSGDGVVMSRTGRAFFAGSEANLGAALIRRVRAALDKADFWNRLATDWVCLDAELMPWSAKAQELVDKQYAPVGEAAVAGLSAVADLLDVAASRGVESDGSFDRITARRAAAERYVAAYQRYVRPVDGVDDLRLAPFHLLATEGSVHTDKTHRWHMDELARICEYDAILTATPFREVELENEREVADAIAWWESLTSAGGEGMVVKPETFLARDKRGLVQPALKVRGREYLRMVYGPEYALPENMERLRERAVAGKRRLAMGEFTLGIEALHRFVEGKPLRSIHECAFGVLALESEPIDPRL